MTSGGGAIGALERYQGLRGYLGREAEGGWDMPKKIWHTYQVCGGGKKMVKTDWVRRDGKDAKRKEGSQSVRRAFFFFLKKSTLHF